MFHRSLSLPTMSSLSSKPDGFTECYACTQVGVPVFHSTRCDQPQFMSVEAPLVPRRSCGTFRRVLDPRSKHVKRWNRAVLLARGMALAVDPLFYNVISMYGSGTPCFYVNVALATILTVVRTCVDLVHLCHLLLQFRLAYVSSESLVVGCGKLVWDTRAIASHNLRSLKGIWLDAFVILPIPQVIVVFNYSYFSSFSFNSLFNFLRKKTKFNIVSHSFFLFFFPAFFI
jgi:cyclic nucleotide gated channel